MENTFNPTRQYFYQSIFYRAINDRSDLPPLDPVIQGYLSPETEKYKEAQSLMGEVKKAFRLHKKEIKQKKEDQKKSVVWKDIIEEIATREPEGIKEEDIQEAGFVKPEKRFDFEVEEKETSFNPAMPVVSFRKMISYNKEDLVSKALAAMTNYIQSKIEFSVTSEAFKHLSECAG